MQLHQYKEYRLSLHNELLDIEEQLATLLPRQAELKALLFDVPVVVATTKRIPPLKKRTAKKTPAKKRATKKVVLTASAKEGTMKKLVDFVRSNPGRSRQNIRAYFGSSLSENQVKNLLSLASKQGLVVNHGNKRYPKWYVAGHQA